MRYGCTKGHFQADCSFGFCFYFEGFQTLSKSFSCICSKKVSKLSNLQFLCTEESFEGIFSCFFFEKVSSFERNFSRKYFLRIRRNNLTFYWSLPCFEIVRVPPERSQTFSPQIQQVVKITNYLFGRSFNSIFLCWLDFSFLKIFGILSDFFCILDEKKDGLLNVHITFPEGHSKDYFFQKNWFRKNQENIQEKLGTCFRKIRHSFCQNSFPRFQYKLCM